ncbi:MAG: hypothetical protein ACLP50_21375 [Solirubrobacteraceae bacterium]
MRSPTLKATRVRALALALGIGALGSLATAPASYAAAGTPAAGANCQSQDGKISGRGATVQLWLEYDLMGAYASDVCGSVPPDASATGGDQTHPGSALYTLTGGTTYQQNWMTQYNSTSAQQLGSSGANAAIGSGPGQTAIGCFAEAFAGSDIPVTSTQLGNINNGTYTGSGSTIESNGKFCNPSGLVSAFTPQGPYPNPGDAASYSPSGVMVFPIGVEAESNFANLPSSCVPSGGLHLSNADEENIWGGTYTNWDQVTDAGIVAGSPCTLAGGGLAIARVVRSDNAASTQSVDNYLADVSDDGSTGICPTNGNSNAASFKVMQNNEANGTSNVNWPTGSGCSTLDDSEGPGGPALIADLETVPGGIGYADLADAENDTNDFKSLIANYTIAEFLVQASNSPTNFQSPRLGTGSNCSPMDTLPGGGSDNAMVGLASSGWNLIAESTPDGGVDDIAYAREGSAYPICSLSWDLVWTGDDGNIANGFTPAPANLDNVVAGATSIPLDTTTVAGVPDSFTSSATNGDITVAGDTISYTGFNASTDTLTGVSGVTNAIPAETTFTYPNGTGGPEANLTADQRRTLYSYFTYVESPAAQATEPGAGYTPLPATWVTAIRSGFQDNF